MRSGCNPTRSTRSRRLARSGVKRLAVVAPGFSADCLETLEELDMENRAMFLANGGEQFSLVPCLNDSDAGSPRHRAHRASRASGLGLTVCGEDKESAAGKKVELGRKTERIFQLLFVTTIFRTSISRGL